MTFNRKTLAASAAALTLGAALFASSAPAEAGYKWGYRHHGGAIAAGVIGGLALGAIAASAAPAYAAPVYEEAVSCYTVKRRFVNAYGDLVIRRERVCE